MRSEVTYRIRREKETAGDFRLPASLHHPIHIVRVKDTSRRDKHWKLEWSIICKRQDANQAVLAWQWRRSRVKICGETS